MSSSKRRKPGSGKSKWRTHLVIPDTQCKPDAPNDHLRWIGNYIVDKRPDVVVMLGDFADMESLSSYNTGRIEAEGKRYAEDIKYAKASMDKLLGPMRKGRWRPELHLNMGNHEARIDKAAQENPRFHGTISTEDLGYREAGWTVHPFLKVVRIDSIEYAHYFIAGVMGRPVSSAAALLRARHCSATMGHVQRVDFAVHPNTQAIGLFAGICYTHEEIYLTSQGQNTKRGIWMKHEVHGGTYDFSFVSLEFLKGRYS